MKCTEFREKMFLRDDELTAEELKGLERHRNDCTACGAEYRSLQPVRRVVQLLQHNEPKLRNPGFITEAILNKLRDDQRPALHTMTVYDRFVAWLSTPGVRLTSASLLFVIVGSFAVEYSSAYVQIKKLETTVAKSSFERGTQSVSTLAPGDAADMISDAAKVIAGKKSYVEVSGDWVMINRGSIKRLVLLYNELQANTPRLPAEFRSTHPRLSQLLDTKREPEQLEALLRDRKTLIEELNDLIPQERK